MFLPYNIVNSSLGLDDLGVCGIQLTNGLLKIWFQIDILYIFIGYGVSAFCGYKVIVKIKHLRGEESDDFPVFYVLYYHFNVSKSS